MCYLEWGWLGYLEPTPKSSTYNGPHLGYLEPSPPNGPGVGYLDLTSTMWYPK